MDQLSKTPGAGRDVDLAALLPHWPVPHWPDRSASRRDPLVTGVGQGLYGALRDAILAGRLVPGARLPASRSLAAALGVARGTVVGAYEQLVAEGYLTARIGDGTRVSADLPDAQLGLSPPRAAMSSAPVPETAPAPAAAPAAGMPAGWPPPVFAEGIGALDQFPLAAWNRALVHGMKTTGLDALAVADPAGALVLRQAVAAHLVATRAVIATPARVLITAGAQQALDLACRMVIGRDEAVWVEDPGYRGIRTALGLIGARPVPVPLDADGFDPDVAEAMAPDARSCILTPSHQYPLGVTLPLARRLRLIDRAAARDGWIIEDDYDSEFRYAGRPIPSLQGLDGHGRTIYIGSFSKVLAPGIRLGYLVAPDGHVDRFAEGLRALGPPSALVLQPALARFITDGHLGRHVRRMRALYARRRAAVIEAIERRIIAPRPGRGMAISAGAGGMSLVLHLQAGTDDVALAAAMARAGMRGSALGPHYLAGAGRRPGLILGFAALPERAADAAAARLARLIG